MAVSLESLSVTRPAASLTQAQAQAQAQVQAQAQAPQAPDRSFATLFSLYSEDNRPGLVPYGVALDAPPAASADDPKVEMDRWQPREERPRDPESALGLGDLLDALNPLHHIPGLATLYRRVTGDEIAPAAKVVGGTLYGGPVGLVSGLVNAVVEQVNGAALDETALAYVFGDDGAADPTAANSTAVAPTTVAAVDSPAETKQIVAAHEAPAPAAQHTKVLTGGDALAAFARDIGRADQASANLVSADPNAPDPQAAAALPARGFPAQMMLGLDKYRQMAIERGGAGMPAIAPAVDRRL